MGIHACMRRALPPLAHNCIHAQPCAPSHHRYGVGIAAGISVVGWLKRKIKQLPVVGLLASPFLSKSAGHAAQAAFSPSCQGSCMHVHQSTSEATTRRHWLA